MKKWLEIVIIPVLAMLAVGIGGFYYYQNTGKNLEQMARDTLQAVAQLKAAQMANWRAERLGDGYTITAGDPLFAETVADWMVRPNSEDAGRIRQRLEATKTAYRYSNVLLAAPDGQVPIQAGNDATILEPRMQALVTEAGRRREVLFANFPFPPGLTNPQIEVITPIIYGPKKTGQFVGAVIFRVDPESFFYPMIRTWPLPSRTAQTLLMRKEEQRAVIFCAPPAVGAQALQLEIPLPNLGGIAGQVTTDGSSFVRGKDYRGVDVCAVIEPVPDSDWLLVAKVDEAEIIQAIRQGTIPVLLVTAALVLVAVAASGLAWQRAGHQARERVAAAELAQQKFALDQHAIVAATDVQGRITYVNDKFCQIAKYSRDELLGQTHRLFQQGEHPPAFFEAMFRSAARGEVWQGEICNRAKDGALFWTDMTIVPFVNSDGKPVRYIAIQTDITERKLLDESLSVARDEALEASRLKSEFLATMSHEIRTPMNAIIGMAGLLADTPLDAEQAQMARTLAGGAESLLTIINDILDFSRIEAGHLRLDQAEFDFRRVVEETVVLLAQRADEKHIELTCELKLAPSCLLLGDGGRVRQILINLIGNAVKFTDAGEVAVTAGVIEEKADRLRVRVTVQDTGIGIPAGAGSSLFQPFVQVDGSTTKRFGGTGLGLAITRQLVEAMGGKIGFESEEGRGSLFWFELELERRGPLDELAHPVVPPGCRMLVVDDNMTSRAILQGQMEKCGVVCEAVASGPAALTRLRRNGAPPFDLILLDWHMPGMDGLELAMEIRADPALASLPLVMLASMGATMEAAKISTVSFAACLTKPVTEDNLVQCLVRVLARSGPEETGVAGTVSPDRALRLLLAEDNTANQRVASMLLAKMGHTVEIAGNGQQALDRLAAQKFDAVLMDCQMPVLDGYEATRRIRSGQLTGVDPQLPVIALTAYARPEDRARCREAGMDGYVSKPIRVGELQAALHGCGLDRLADTAGAPEKPVVLDAEAVAIVRALPGTNGASLLPELIELYLGDEHERLERLARLIETRQGEELATEAHSFGGNAASFGGQEVRHAALELEFSARAADWSAVETRLIGLRAASARLRNELGTLCAPSV